MNPLGFDLDPADNISYAIHGKPVSKSEFLHNSFGARATVSGISQIRHEGADTGDVGVAKAISFNIVQTLPEWSSSCLSCKTFLNYFMNFKYSEDWKIKEDQGELVILERAKFYSGERDCNDITQPLCACADGSLCGGYRILIHLVRAGYDLMKMQLPESEIHNLYTNLQNSIYMQDYNHRYFFTNIYSDPFNQQAFSLLIDFQMIDDSGVPFPSETPSYMPYLLLGTLRVNNPGIFNAAFDFNSWKL